MARSRTVFLLLGSLTWSIRSWVDIFAVRQWPGNVVDLDFRLVVKEADAFLLCARHVQEVVDMSSEDINALQVPEVATRICAFFRLWCVVELAAAQLFEKPVVMLIGCASEEDRHEDRAVFKPNQDMINQLWQLLDVRKAVASVEADRVRELAIVEAREGGADAVNSLGRGALNGASVCMDRPDILRAAVGDLKPLRALSSKQEREAAMILAAAAGYEVAVLVMVEMGARVEAKIETGMWTGTTALMMAAYGGHTRILKALITSRGADVQVKSKYGETALMKAVQGQHLPAVKVLLDEGADVQAKRYDGATALMFGDSYMPVLEALLTKGADVQAKDDEGKTTADQHSDDLAKHLLSSWV